MIKHVGKHNSKKVVVLFRKVPGEDHMCLVTYTESLPSRIHDDIAKVLESPVGQQAENFADALDRNVGTDGNNILHTLHRENYIKKVQTNQVIMVPNAKSQVRLDELNDIIDKLAQGGEAAEKMAEIDSQAGLRDPAKTTTNSINTSAEVLDDVSLAKNMLSQADAMLAEAKRLQEEAYSLDPSLKPKAPVRKTTATTSKSTSRKTAPAKKTTSKKAEAE